MHIEIVNEETLPDGSTEFTVEADENIIKYWHTIYGDTTDDISRGLSKAIEYGVKSGEFERCVKQ